MDDLLHIFCSHCGAEWILSANDPRLEDFHRFRMWGCEGWGGEHIDTETVTSERAAAMVYAATIFEIDGVDPQTAAKWFDVFATADNPIAWRHR